LSVCGMLLVVASTASAQARNWQERGFIGLNVGVQPQSQTFTETATPTVYGEPASVTVLHAIGSHPVFDVTAAARVFENYGIGLSYSRVSASESAPFTAQVPNPVVFGRPRLTNGTATDLVHTENVVHVYGLWMMS